MNIFLIPEWEIVPMIIITVIAILTACMDTIVDHWGISIFSKIKNQWLSRYFNHNENWKDKYEQDENGDLIVDDSGHYIRKKWFWFIKVHPVIYSGWHLFRVLVVVGIVYVIIYFVDNAFSITVDVDFLYICRCLFYYGLLWNIPFNSCYDYLLKMEFWDKLIGLENNA